MYQYFLFRIYKFYQKYESANLTFTTAIISSLIISLNLLTFIFVLNYFEIGADFLTNSKVLILMLFIIILNYYRFVKQENFLKLEFKQDLKGGFAVITVFILTLIFVIAIGALNRNKIFNKNKERLESKIYMGNTDSADLQSELTKYLKFKTIST
jgi:amino acid transporter